MSVLISGMKLPKDCVIKVAIRGDDGIASVYLDEGKADYYSVIELPDHGDLIDRDDVENAALMIWVHNSNGDDAMEQTIEHIRHNIEAVIPAERSEE